MTEQTTAKEEDVIAKLDAFAELPDAPPKRRLKLSWVGKLGVAVVVFWLIIVAVCGLAQIVALAISIVKAIPSRTIRQTLITLIASVLTKFDFCLKTVGKTF